MKNSIAPNTENSDLIANVIKTGTTISSGIQLTRTIFSSIAIAVILIFAWIVGVPWYAILIFAVVATIVLVGKDIRCQKK
jgi:hypothetical protein